jgi:hypothetical protein
MWTGDRVDDTIKLHDIVVKGQADSFLKDKDKLNFFIRPRFEFFRKFIDQLNPDFKISLVVGCWLFCNVH